MESCMITEKLTEEFLENHYFVLESDYEIEIYDENGISTDTYATIFKGTEWQVSDNNYIGGEIHLDGLSTSGWIEITEKTFRSMFTVHKWLMHNK